MEGENSLQETPNEGTPGPAGGPSRLLPSPRFTSDTDTTATASGGSLADSNVPAPTSATAASNALATAQNVNLPAIDTLTDTIPRFHIRQPSRQNTPRTPSEAGLHIETGGIPIPSKSEGLDIATGEEQRDQLPPLGESGQSFTERPGALRSTLSATSMHSVYSQSPGSRISSPMINALPDITPLPSPLPGGESPGGWKTRSRPGSSGSASGSMSRSLREEVLLEANSPVKMKQKGYGGLSSAIQDEATTGSPQRPQSNRSISEFQPGAMHNERPRNVTIGATEAMQVDSTLHREKYLAEQRGLVAPAASAPGALPTPPSSNRSVTESELDETREEGEFEGYMAIREGSSKRRRKYRPVRPLGAGTFSKVMLATSEKLPAGTKLDETSESWLNPKNLVAIKVVQHGPAGGADADRVDLGLKREVEILRSLAHPTLIHLKAFDWTDQEALIVLNYCAGGDLFDLASQRRELLTPNNVQRIFAELVDAVRYLHSLWIVHRDIKLENVLVNLPASTLAEITDISSYPYPIISLTDLGLSRKIPQPPESPLLTTRCGSEDYAAPEILLGQPYDGRQTDAWAVGVLTYALMEGRLPFDPPPVRPGQRPVRSRAAHRIARCDWMWCEYGDEDGEWDPVKGKDWEGARECIEGLLKKVSRGRLSLDQIAEKEFVKNAVPEGGLRRAPHADDEES